MKKLITKKEYKTIIRYFNQCGGFGGNLKTVNNFYLEFCSDSSGYVRTGVITIYYIGDSPIIEDYMTPPINKIYFEKTTSYESIYKQTTKRLNMILEGSVTQK